MRAWWVLIEYQQLQTAMTILILKIIFQDCRTIVTLLILNFSYGYMNNLKPFFSSLCISVSFFSSNVLVTLI